MWVFPFLCIFMSAYLCPAFWIYVYIYEHTFTHKYVILCNIHFCSFISAQMAQGCVGQDSHLCETAAGLVLEFHWLLCLSFERNIQIERLCTAPALSISVLHTLSPQNSSTVGRCCILLLFRESWGPLGTDSPELRRESKTSNCFFAPVSHAGKWPLNLSLGGALPASAGSVQHRMLPSFLLPTTAAGGSSTCPSPCLCCFFVFLCIPDWLTNFFSYSKPDSKCTWAPSSRGTTADRDHVE